MGAILGIRPCALAASLSLCGCFAVVDVDRFHSADGGLGSTARLSHAGAYLDLKLSLVGMKPHVAQLFEFRIIDGSNYIQARGDVNPLGIADTTINMPLSIPKVNGPFHLDFWADVEGLGYYDKIGSVISNDHAWRIDPLQDYPPDTVTPVDGLVQVTFTHNTSFTEINQYPSGTPNVPHDTGLAATIHVVNATDLQGDLIQVRVADTGGNRTIGVYRLPQIIESTFDLSIPGVVESGADYEAFLYVDANGNGAYDNPATKSGDLGWSVSGTADATGLHMNIDAADIGSGNVDVGAP
jgi:hypothetical protein